MAIQLIIIIVGYEELAIDNDATDPEIAHADKRAQLQQYQCQVIRS